MHGYGGGSKPIEVSAHKGLHYAGPQEEEPLRDWAGPARGREGGSEGLGDTAVGETLQTKKQEEEEEGKKTGQGDRGGRRTKVETGGKSGRERLPLKSPGRTREGTGDSGDKEAPSNLNVNG